MAIPLYLAMTAAEFRSQTDFSAPVAWMACHFSPYSTGLTNLPKSLPKDSMLILNDRTPICGHDPQLIYEVLLQTVERTKACCVLLDLQRPDVEETGRLVRALVETLPCPVAVSHHYAQGFTCPVFLPPVPLTVPPEEYLMPWQGRDIWLEAALDGQSITVTEKGALFTPLPHCCEASAHADGSLHCHYRIDVEDTNIRFTLHRTKEDLQALLADVQRFGVSHAVGLYQELGK